MTRKIFILEAILTAAALATALMALPHLPAIIPVHWDQHGSPNGSGLRGRFCCSGPVSWP